MSVRRFGLLSCVILALLLLLSPEVRSQTAPPAQPSAGAQAAEEEEDQGEPEEEEPKQPDSPGAWTEYLKRMKTSFAEIKQAVAAGADAWTEQEAWTRFLNEFQFDHASSKEDDLMRAFALKRQQELSAPQPRK